MFFLLTKVKPCSAGLVFGWVTIYKYYDGLEGTSTFFIRDSFFSSATSFFHPRVFFSSATFLFSSAIFFVSCDFFLRIRLFLSATFFFIRHFLFYQRLFFFIQNASVKREKLCKKTLYSSTEFILGVSQTMLYHNQNLFLMVSYCFCSFGEFAEVFEWQV